MITVNCERCNEPREVTRIRPDTKYCKPCASLIRREKLNVRNLKWKMVVDKHGKSSAYYLRVCGCGNEKWVSYYPKEGAECCSCAASKVGYTMSQNNIRPKEELKRYERICTGCGATSYLTSDPKKYRSTSLCGDCSRKEIGKANAKPKLFVRHCVSEGCDDIEMVSSKANSVGKMCKSCRSKLPKKKKANYPKNRKSVKVKNVVSKQAIDRARAINKEHRENAVKATPKKRNPLSEKDMVAKFLKTNKPSVVDDSTEIPHFVGKAGFSHNNSSISM